MICGMSHTVMVEWVRVVSCGGFYVTGGTEDVYIWMICAVCKNLIHTGFEGIQYLAEYGVKVLFKLCVL